MLVMVDNCFILSNVNWEVFLREYFYKYYDLRIILLSVYKSENSDYREKKN